MRNIKIILVFFTVFFASIKAEAQYQGTYVGFEVVGSSALMVNQNATSTTFNIKIFVSRFYGTGGYQPFYMNFKLGIENGAVFTNVYTITSSDFQSGQGNAEKQFSVTLQNSSLPHGKSLLIHYNNLSNSNPSYTASYNPNVSIFNPPPVTPPAATITNNVISLYNNGGNFPAIIGTIPTISSGEKYGLTYQKKNSNGVFEPVLNWQGMLIVGKEVNGVAVNGLVSDISGGIFRRVITSASAITSYSNEIVVPPTMGTAVPNSYTVTKTEVFDNNGMLIGNNIKINLLNPDPNIRFSAMLFGPDDPYYLPINSNYEFFMPMYYNNDKASYYPETNASVIFSTNATNIGSNSPLGVVPTWR